MVVESPGSVLFRTEAVPVGARKKSDFAVPRRWGQSPASFPDHFPRPSQRPIEGRQAVRRSEVPPRPSSSRVGPPWAYRRPSSRVHICGTCAGVESCPSYQVFPRIRIHALGCRGAFTRKIFEDPSSVRSNVPRGSFEVEPPLSRRRRRGKGPRLGGSLPQRAERSGVERSPFLFLSRSFPFPSRSRGFPPLLFSTEGREGGPSRPRGDPRVYVHCERMHPHNHSSAQRKRG